jgi:hypothetical protein
MAEQIRGLRAKLGGHEFKAPRHEFKRRGFTAEESERHMEAHSLEIGRLMTEVDEAKGSLADISSSTPVKASGIHSSHWLARRAMSIRRTWSSLGSR